MGLQHYSEQIEVTPLVFWERWGSLEHYFKFRFRDCNRQSGSLTEYFRFDADAAKKVLRELRRLKPRELSEREQQILAGKPSAVSQKAKANQSGPRTAVRN